MATCKDCLHYKACSSMLKAMGYTVDGDGLDADKRCDTFTPRAALDILIAHATCCEPNLNCADHCPFYNTETSCDSWDNNKLADAVKLLKKGEHCDT